ncbi:MAG: hypothetical protein NVS9B4_16370 [Candidatus Acidiferrum sp.]
MIGQKHSLLGVLALCLALTEMASSQTLPSAAPSSAAALSSKKTSQIRDHLHAAQIHLQSNDTASAATELRAALVLDPHNVEALVNLGVVQMFQGDCTAASQNFTQALTSQPSLVKAKALLGICGRRLGDSRAKALLEGSFPKITSPQLHTQVGMELIGLYYTEDDPERAVAIVQQLVDSNPENVDILYIAQRLYGELAEDTLNKLAVLAPGSARMQQVVAERLVNAGDLKGASEHYRKALEINPRLSGAHYELAEAILESSPADSAAQAEAEKELETVITSEGDSAKVQCELGRIAMLRADNASALSHYTRAFQLNPRDVGAQLGLGRVFMSLEKPEEARKYLELAVKSDPLNNEAHYHLAFAYKRLQMTEQSQKEMHLFQEIKKTKDKVKKLYQQMNRQPKPESLPEAAQDPGSSGS